MHILIYIQRKTIAKTKPLKKYCANVKSVFIVKWKKKKEEKCLNEFAIFLEPCID